MIQKKFKIIANYPVTQGYYKLIIKAPQIAKTALPGQFINIKVSNDYEPFLRRPFSIHKIKNQKSKIKNEVQILYKVIGKSTQILSQRKAGDYLDVIGPLGNGFSILDTSLPRAKSRGYSILVAGGMGVAPLIFLAEKVLEDRRQKTEDRIMVLIGAKTKSQILCEKDFDKLGCEIKISTDDGSKGFKGKIAALLNKILSSDICHLTTVIYACGPKPMLKEVALLSKRHRISAQVSLEEHMACGIGACFGCVVNTKQGHKRVCKDGPVFNAEEIIWQ
ncbi:MAG: dihydroorotate dehydrogenase electron transfer subunit [Candidatus Omnitrophota bacterium]|nr:dihydroorotate dehydrogenase electron transfer subunit [Candidatus Omnitrophota bacterium]